jgi:hypothetical protein
VTRDPGELEVLVQQRELPGELLGERDERCLVPLPGIDVGDRRDPDQWLQLGDGPVAKLCEVGGAR